MCEAGKKRPEVSRKTFTALCVYVCVQREGWFKPVFLPRLHIYVGGISLVNIGLKQTLKSLITFQQTLLYSVGDTASERKKQGEEAPLIATLFQGWKGKSRIKWNSSEVEMPRKHWWNTTSCFSKVWSWVQWSDVVYRPGEIRAGTEVLLNQEKLAKGSRASCDIYGVGFFLQFSNNSCLLLGPVGSPWNPGPDFIFYVCWLEVLNLSHKATACLPANRAAKSMLLTFPTTYTHTCAHTRAYTDTHVHAQNPTQKGSRGFIRSVPSCTSRASYWIIQSSVNHLQSLWVSCRVPSSHPQHACTP